MEFKRDEAREELFYSAHHIKPVIKIRYELNDDKSFKTIDYKFVLKDNEWIIHEEYKGNSNLTDYVTLTGVKEPFNSPRGAFNEAEHKLVEFMKEVNG